MTDAPQPRRQRIVLCRGPYCSLGGRAERLYKHLEARLGVINGDIYPPPVKLETANCLSLCGAGPNLILYPDGIIVNGLDVDKLDRFLDTHALRIP